MSKYYEVNLKYKPMSGESVTIDKIIVKKGHFYAKEISTGYPFYVTEQENLIILRNEFYIMKNEFIEKNIVSFYRTIEYIDIFNLEEHKFKEKVQIFQNKKEQSKIKQYLKRGN